MIIQKFLPTNTKRRSGQKLLGVKFIVAHDTGNPNSTALGNVDYFIKSANELEASAHTFIDDVNIIECIPQTEKAWHVIRNVTTDNVLFGGDANDIALGIELCYFPQDIARSQKAYEAYCAYIRDLCTKFQLDPQTHVKGHFQLNPERKTDPMNAFKVINKTFDQFLQDLEPQTDDLVNIQVPKSKLQKILNFLLNI